jgi:hypothetical protein
VRGSWRGNQPSCASRGTPRDDEPPKTKRDNATIPTMNNSDNNNDDDDDDDDDERSYF